MAHGHHISSTRTLATVFGGLVSLTILTVVTSRMELGALNVPLAMVIAGIKAMLVVGFFMALKYDNRVNALVFAVGALFVVVFLSLTLLDTAFRGDLPNTTKGTIMEQEAADEALRSGDSGDSSSEGGRHDSP
jgi:cytochrome c oxidase subunit IV